MPALYTLNRGSAKISNRTISTSAPDTSALVALGMAVLELDNSTVTTAGAAAAGGSAATVLIDDAAIYLNADVLMANGFGTPAFLVRNGGVAELAGTNTITATGDAAAAVAVLSGAALLPQGGVLSASAAGQSAAALFIGRGSSALLFHGNLDAPAATSNAIFDAGQVNLTQTDVSAGGRIAVLDDGAALTLTQCFADGKGILIQNTSGDVKLQATVLVDGGFLSGPADTFDVVGAKASIRVLNLSTVQSGPFVSATGGSGVSVALVSTSISGSSFAADVSSALALDLSSGSNIIGTLSNVDLVLEPFDGLLTTGTSTLASLSNAGTISADVGVFAVAGPATNTGVIGANGSVVVFGRAGVTNQGHLTIGAGGTMWFQGGSQSGDVQFGDASGTLRLDDVPDFHTTIGGFRAGDAIDLGVHSVSLASPSPDGGGKLELSVDGAAAALSLAGSYPGSFTLNTSAAGHAIIGYSPNP